MMTDDLSEREAHADWDRWHELLTIRDTGRMTPAERVEYERLLPLVSELDQREVQETCRDD